ATTSLRRGASRGHSVPPLRERQLPAPEAFAPCQTIGTLGLEKRKQVFFGEPKSYARKTGPDEPLRANKLPSFQPFAPLTCRSGRDGSRSGYAAYWRCNRCRGG